MSRYKKKKKNFPLNILKMESRSALLLSRVHVIREIYEKKNRFENRIIRNSRESRVFRNVRRIRKTYT